MAILFDVPNELPVSLAVFNANGQRVKTLASGTYPVGPRRITWTGEDEFGVRVAPGVYFVRLDTSNWKETKRFVFVR
jgi:flagellar hook assembly protein FlgD